MHRGAVIRGVLQIVRVPVVHASTLSRRSLVTGAPSRGGSFTPRGALFVKQQRFASSKSSVDEIIEDITEQYGTAKDEFEIAQEETEKMTVYAEDDRKAAREELDILHKMYNDAVAGPDGEEIKRRIGQRIRELDSAVKNLEEMAMNQD